MASTSKLEKVLADVTGKITPSQKERKGVDSLANILLRKVKTATQKSKVEATIRVEGSIAKDTWLSGEPDIDIFLQLPRSVPRAALGTVCLKIAREATRGSRQIERFAEHPYLEAFVNSTRINIVPCYKARPGEWMSATDRTPYHTDFVIPLLNDSLKSEIRLLKRFMKGIGVYGAEIKVGGFSGYLCELLTMQYGTFVNVLNAVSAWKKPWTIDYQGYYEDREDEIPKIFQEPLVVVDPVDKGRNVASAVRKECLIQFVAASRQFMLHPSVEFFLPKSLKVLSRRQLLQSMEKRGTALVFVKIGKVKAVPDILWGQLYKTQRSLRRMLVQKGFSIIGDAAWSNDLDLSVLLFEAEHGFLSATKKHLGPPVERRIECERFLRKHFGAAATVYGPRLEDERWVVGVKRQYTDIVECMKTELKHGGRHVGVAELISKAVADKPDVLVNQQITDTYGANRGFAEFLTQYIQGKPKWLRASA